MKSKRLSNFTGEQNNMAKKLQKVQTKLDEVSKEIEEMSFIGISGGGVVEVMLKGDKNLISIKVSDDFKNEMKIKEDEKGEENSLSMLLDLIVAAANDGLSKIDEYTDKEISKITKGIPIPGLN